jgi:hypothetical protein
MKVDRVHRRTQAEDDVRPALAAGWPVVEFAKPGAMRSFLWIFLADAERGQAVEHPEFPFAEPFIDHRSRSSAGEPARFADRPRGLARAQVGRGEDHLRLLGIGKVGEPAPGSGGLLVTELGQRHVHVAHVDANGRQPLRLRLVARDIPLTLAVADEVEALGPVTGWLQTKVLSQPTKHEPRRWFNLAAPAPQCR